MACRQQSQFGGVTGFGSGAGGFATEAECLEACKEGACCNGTTCSVKPQCQCNAEAGFGFQGVGTTCSPNPCNIGACCVGPTCYQRSEEQCATGVGSPPRLGVFLGDNVPCDPNPCCPDCGRSANGGCCRNTYINDGWGACCPNDCCSNGAAATAGASNGSCCDDLTPNCCLPQGFITDFLGQQSRQCQASPPLDIGREFLLQTDACQQGGVRRVEFSVPSGSFTLRISIFGEVNSSRLAWPTRVSIDVGSGASIFELGQSAVTGFILCKPNNVSTIVIEVLEVFEQRRGYSNSPTPGIPGIITSDQDCALSVPSPDQPPPVLIPAWGVQVQVWNSCECNPLP